MAFHLPVPGQNDPTKAEKKPANADAAKIALNDLFDMNDDTPDEAPATSSAPAPAESTPATPKEKKTSPPAKKKDTSKKASPKGKKGPTFDYTTDTKLRKDSSDPTAKRISARVSNEIYTDLMYLRAQGMSMDYTITSSLQTVLYNKYICSCGMVFFTDGNHGDPKCCPACGNPGFHKERIR